MVRHTPFTFAFFKELTLSSPNSVTKVLQKDSLRHHVVIFMAIGLGTTLGCSHYNHQVGGQGRNFLKINGAVLRRRGDLGDNQMIGVYKN